MTKWSIDVSKQKSWIWNFGCKLGNEKYKYLQTTIKINVFEKLESKRIYTNFMTLDLGNSRFNVKLFEFANCLGNKRRRRLRNDLTTASSSHFVCWDKKIGQFMAYLNWILYLKNNTYCTCYFSMYNISLK